MKLNFHFSQFYRNIIALGTGATYQTITQLVSIPILLSVFHIEKYAEWLIAFNIAAFTMLLDFGTITSTQNSFKFLNARNKKDEVNRRVKQISNLLLLAFLGYLVFLTCVHQISSSSFNLSLTAMFVLSNLFQSYFGLLESLTRMDSKTALGIYSSTALRMAEFIGTMIGLLLFPRSLIGVALCGIVIKCIFFVLIIIRLRSRYNFIQIGKIDLTLVIQNIREGAAFLVLKSSEWILISGTVIVLHGKISSSNLVLFISARTFFRLGLQLTSLITLAYGYEMTSCWALNDYSGMLRLIRKSSRVSAVLSFIGFILYTTIGMNLFSIWMHSKLELSHEIVLWGAFYTLLLSISQNQKTKFNSINLNSLLSLVQMMSSLALVAFIYLTNTTISVVNVFAMITITEMISYLTIRILTRNKVELHFQGHK